VSVQLRQIKLETQPQNETLTTSAALLQACGLRYQESIN